MLISTFVSWGSDPEVKTKLLREIAPDSGTDITG